MSAQYLESRRSAEFCQFDTPNTSDFRAFPNVTCVDVTFKIVTQAKAWASADNCAQGGEKYNITLDSHSIV